MFSLAPAPGVIGGQEKVQSTESYILIAPGTVHSSWTEASPLQEAVLHLRVSVLETLTAELGLLGARWPSGLFALTSQIRRAMDQLQAGEATPGEGLARALIEAHQGPLKSASPHQIDPRLARLVALIRKDPSQPMDLSRMSELAQMSRSHLVRSFKQAFGLPPMVFLKKQRLQLACDQMMRTQQSLTTIAHATGFSSSGRFSEAFRAAFGESPAQWRRHRSGPLSRAPSAAESAGRSQSPARPCRKKRNRLTSGPRLLSTAQVRPPSRVL